MITGYNLDIWKVVPVAMQPVALYKLQTWQVLISGVQLDRVDEECMKSGLLIVKEMVNN